MIEKAKIVGDVTSNARGSGARYNYGKARLDLIPLVYIANSFNSNNYSDQHKVVHTILYFTGIFQESGDSVFLDQAMLAAKNYWEDCAKVFEYGANKYSLRGECTCEGGSKSKQYRLLVKQETNTNTLINLENSEKFFAIPATSALDLSKGVIIGLQEHSNICNVHKIEKSGNWNWVKGMNWSVPIGCIGRHSLKVLAKNELIDEESGLSHIGHIMCNLVMLKAFSNGYEEGNDLPPENLSVKIV